MNTQINELLYNDSPNFSAQGAAIIKVGDSLNSSVLSAGVAESFNKLKPFIEQLNSQIKPFKESLNKVLLQFKPLIDSIKTAGKYYVKFLSSKSISIKEWVKALFTPSFLIASRFLSPPKFLTNKHYKLHSFFLTVLSSVITPNAPN